jgi:hypothetical protein
MRLTSSLVASSKNWASEQERPTVRDRFALWAERTDLHPPSASRLLISVYEQLRLYLLTSEWEPPVRRIHGTIALAITMVSFTLASYYIVLPGFGAPSDVAVRFWVAVALILALASYLLVFRPVAGQMTSGQKWILRILVAIPQFFWFTAMISTEAGKGLGLETFLWLWMLCLAGLGSMVPLCAFWLQWRLLSFHHAIGAWFVANSSSHRRHDVSRVTAWLLLLAPDKEDKMGWQRVEDVNYLMEIGRVEREGAEWRNTFLTIVTLAITLSSLTSVLNHISDTQIRIPMVLTPANPGVVGGGIFLLLLVWGALVDMWLSGFTNQTIALACVEAKRALTRSDGTLRAFEDYRAITLSNPEAFQNEPRARWTLIARRRLPDSQWRCLVQARSWFRHTQDSDETAVQSYH